MPDPDRARRLPGLDALRGFAVAAVVAFHLWPTVVPGGFLGVSLFFTLSGYLIVARLVAERHTTGSIALRAFWGRRARRLWPASLAVLAVVASVWLAAGWLTDDTSRGIVASLFNVANWHEIASHHTYAVDPTASPVLHFWSLSIEEQIYLVLPLIVLVGRTRRALVAALSGLLGLSVWATFRWAGNSTVVYYSTFTRAAEVLLGALAAVLVVNRRRTRAPARWGEPLGAITAVAGVAVLLVLMVRTSLGTQAYYDGGLIAIGLLSMVTVTALSHSGMFGARLDLTLMGHLGKISYGVYLIHWPLLVGLRRAGLRGWSLDGTTLLLTLALAELSFHFLEQPIRRAPSTQRRPLRIAAAVAAAFTLVCAAAVPGSATSEAERLAEAHQDFNARYLSTTTTTSPTSTTAPLPPGHATVAPEASSSAAAPRPVRVAMFGDSKTTTLGLGMVPMNDPRVAMLGGSSEFQCPLGRSDRIRSAPDAPGEAVSASCNWARTWPAAIARSGRLDVALVYFGTWDVLDQQASSLPAGWWHVGQPAFDAWLKSEMAAATDLLARDATHVVWLTITPFKGRATPERYDSYRRVLYEFAAESHGAASVLDLGGWLESTGELDRLLPDGVHTTWKNGGTAKEIGDRFLVPAIEDIARQGNAGNGQPVTAQPMSRGR